MTVSGAVDLRAVDHEAPTDPPGSAVGEVREAPADGRSTPDQQETDTRWWPIDASEPADEHRDPTAAAMFDDDPDPAERAPAAPVPAPDEDEPVATDEHLFRTLYPGLRRFAAVVRPQGTDPDDLVQDAVERVLRRRPLASLDDPGPYLRRAIVNLAANERRRLGRQARALLRLGPPSSEPEPATVDEGLLRSLKPADRALLWLVDVEGHTFEQAAPIVGCSPDAARARASRARRHLRGEADGERP